MTAPFKRAGGGLARGAFGALLIVALLLACPLFGGGALAATRARRVVLVVVDRIGLQDLAENPALPNITKMMAEGSTGLMMARIRYDEYGIGGYTMIGAGGRVIAGDNAGLAYNVNELLSSPDGTVVKAGNVYRSRLRRSTLPGSVVNLSIEEMVRASSTYVSTSKPGVLGEALGLEGRKVAVFGNADDIAPTAFGQQPGGPDVVLSAPPAPLPPGSKGTPPPYPMQTLVHREVSCIAMNKRGYTPVGDVSARLYNAGKTGFDTNFTALVGEVTVAIPSNDLTVVDMGETTRVDQRSDFASDRATEQAREKALAECDSAIGAISQQLDYSSDLMIMCTPTPSRKMISEGDLLTPLLVRGPGFEKDGTLRSETTRRTGLVSNFDVAPTVLQSLGVSVPAEMEGQAIVSRPGMNVNSLLDLDAQAVASSNVKSTLTKIFAIPGMILVGLLLLLTLVRPEFVFDHPYFWAVLLLWLMALPLVYLLLPLMALTGTFIPILVSVALAFLFSGLCLLAFLLWNRRKNESGERVEVLSYVFLRSMLLLSGVTLVLVLLDPVLGSPMIALSPFGAGLIAGGRFYGIGNIYMGIAIGSAILVSCMLPHVFPKLLRTNRRALVTAMVIMLVTVFVLGFGRLGANVGAIITGVAATLFVGIKIGGKKIGWKQVVVIALVVVIFLGLLLLLDRVLPGATSHGGKALTRIQGNGISDALSVLARKVSLDWKLILTSIWRLFFFMGVLAAIVWARKYAMFSEVDERYPYLATAWPALIFAIIVALIFKDTGIESAGSMMLYYIVPAFALFMAGRAFQPAFGRKKIPDEGPWTADGDPAPETT